MRQYRFILQRQFQMNKLKKRFISDTLHTIDYSSKEITDRGVVELCAMLLTNQDAKTVDLWDNKLTESAGVVIGQLLMTNDTLTTLNLGIFGFALWIWLVKFIIFLWSQG